MALSLNLQVMKVGQIILCCFLEFIFLLGSLVERSDSGSEFPSAWIFLLSQG